MTAQSSTVEIINNGTSFLSYSIGVSAESNCGTGSTYWKTVIVDYPFSLDAQDIGNGAVRFSVNISSDWYYWHYPEGWTLIYDYGNTIDVYPNGIAGNVIAYLNTPCGTFAQQSYSYTASGCNLDMQAYPTQFEDYIMVDPGSTMIAELQLIDDYGAHHSINYWMEGNLYRIDTWNLPRGWYNLYVTDYVGCISHFRMQKPSY